MSGTLAGKTALVTGGARGIGRAIATALADNGARVALADLQGAEQAADEIVGRGGDAIGLACDVTDEQAMVAMFEALDGRWDGIDIAVSSAGILEAGPLAQTSLADFDRVLRVNLHGTFLTGREALKRMEGAGGGRFIAISSELGQSGRETFSAYVASKHAVIGLVRCWAKEFAPQICVNAICPGPIDTDMLNADGMSPEWRTKELEIPAGRFGRPEEVAALAVYLAGPDAGFVTGQCLGINGGAVMA